MSTDAPHDDAAKAAAKAARIKLYDFIGYWGKHGDGNELNERQGAQQHFVQLCDLLGVSAPNHADDYCFEKSIIKDPHRRSASSPRGFADVFKRGYFAWEYKAPHRSLEPALAQLRMYSLALDNPPLLIACDRLSYEIHTQFTGTPSQVIRIAHDKLDRPDQLAILRRAFTDPNSFKPQQTVAQLTEEAAQAFAKLSDSLRTAGAPQPQVAHFLSQCVFCMFAEDIGLLADRKFEQLISIKKPPEVLRTQLSALFNIMCTGGVFGYDDVPWFNGGLFATVDVPALAANDLLLMRSAVKLNWRDIDVSIFGTLFERGLDPAKRSQLGAHYTDPATILRIVQPVVARPLEAQWQAVNAQLQALKDDPTVKTKAQEKARETAMYAAYRGFLEQLRRYRVLDPACGSGNFLFLSLKVLKDIEHQANIAVEVLGLQREIDNYTSPANVLGIELDSFAAELARLSVWIGELQWRFKHGYPFLLEPVLQPLGHIECRDALLNDDGTVASWPQASVVVGNPPFIGGSKKRGELGDAYFAALNAAYVPRGVPGGADLVCYFFEQAREAIMNQGLGAAGFVATQAIRQGANRSVLEAIVRDTRIFEAHSDLPWVNNGAAVRVSNVAFGNVFETRLNGEAVDEIYANLTGGDSSTNITTAKPLKSNLKVAFQGPVKVGAFEIPGKIARSWLRAPNPNARSNQEVLKLWANGQSVAGRNTDMWIIDFGIDFSEIGAALFELPFHHVLTNVKPMRNKVNRASRKELWWRHGETVPALRNGLFKIGRFIATPRVAKHRYFVWLDSSVLPDSRLYAICRDDDCTFGILSSRIHEVWSLANVSMHGDGGTPTYNAKSCFETFPFPAGLSPLDTASQAVHRLDNGAVLPVLASNNPHAGAIAQAAHSLNTLREQWLNPAAWTDTVPEVVPLGMAQSPYPDRIVPKPDLSAADAKSLSQRTLTHLYNQRPAWLAQAHAALDAAVAAAYGWTDYTAQTTDAQILQRLLALNVGYNKVPNAETQAAMQEADEMVAARAARFNSPDALSDSLDSAR